MSAGWKVPGVCGWYSGSRQEATIKTTEIHRGASSARRTTVPRTTPATVRSNKAGKTNTGINHVSPLVQQSQASCDKEHDRHESPLRITWLGPRERSRIAFVSEAPAWSHEQCCETCPARDAAQAAESQDGRRPHDVLPSHPRTASLQGCARWLSDGKWITPLVASAHGAVGTPTSPPCAVALLRDAAAGAGRIKKPTRIACGQSVD
jgi:hypothetical protein